MITNDEWSEYVRNGQAFACTILATAVPAMIPEVQLFNPVGSGVRLRVRNLEPMTLFGFGLNQNIWRLDTPITSTGVFGIVENLLGGGSAPLAEQRFDNVAALPAAGRWWLFLVAGNTRVSYPAKPQPWGHDLLPGQGLMNNGAIGGSTFVGYEWAEVPL